MKASRAAVRQIKTVAELADTVEALASEMEALSDKLEAILRAVRPDPAERPAKRPKADE